MDATDKRILNLLQRDASLSLVELADRVGLSTSPCWRRIQALEKSGVIRQRVALLDPDRLGLGLAAFVRVRTNQHNQAWFDSFATAVEKIDEIVEFYRMSGDLDYLLKIVVPDIAGYDAVYKRLIASVDLTDVSASFVMEEIKATTELPLDYAGTNNPPSSGSGKRR
ncbi:Lrp/AsnC family transcriptional regulator [Limibacillus sp. MBR-115]|jgi:Lrp/AsnC family transcriptional regulator|uniref:Lrp/AsnC family transcriptional regulator n=1 Tax=Limibacillus sp. MBR-115 TaxID=3156465 RepID=UPI0033958BBB